ncbi:hypothetical protein RIF29_24958 [Crotalaria pallida]|uniref:Replication protein A 70 kDa DNA-binding subunit B/D first OB fold domain-containing protein n=1 Tax=Crotalaria pallida TaxID=3830 RepID=A0AAN9ESW7_CROPI
MTFLHLLLVDAYGNRIQATVPDKLLSSFLHLLRDGVAYTISSIASVPNVGRYRWTPHLCALSFMPVTQVIVEECSVIPNHSFSFGSIDSVFMPFFSSDILRDVIGLLTTVTEEISYVKDEISTPAIMLELSDQYGTMDCCLFGEHVLQLHQFLAVNSAIQTVVVVQLCRMHLCDGRIVVHALPGVSNIMFNPDIYEASQLKSRMFEHGFFDTIPSMVGSGRRTSVEDQFMCSYPRITLEQLSHVNEVDCCHQCYAGWNLYCPWNNCWTEL